MYTYIHKDINIYTHKYIHTHIYITHTYIYIYTYKDIYTYTYVHTYTYIHKHTHISVPISGSRFANYELFLRFHEPLFEEFQKKSQIKRKTLPNIRGEIFNAFVIFMVRLSTHLKSSQDS